MARPAARGSDPYTFIAQLRRRLMVNHTHVQQSCVLQVQLPIIYEQTRAGLRLVTLSARQ